MIDVQNLTKHYGPVTAIRDVSFSVAPGEIVGFLGPNGAGKDRKSTRLNSSHSRASRMPSSA